MSVEQKLIELGYTATEDGKVFSCYNGAEIKGSLVGNEGYKKLQLRTKVGRVYLHRFVWAFFNGPIPEGVKIFSRDGDPNNIALSNLEIG